jgi:hypothetical protein
MAVCGPEGVLAHRVVALCDLYQVAKQWVESYQVQAIIVGNQTASKRVFDIMAPLGCPVEGVPERDSTMQARRRYFRDHPPKGWRRWLPLSLQIPPEPYDDYAAVVLAESYLQDAQGRP